MRIAVVTTMSGYLWGGSEYLWAAMVDEALKANHKVGVYIYHWDTHPPSILDMERRGAYVFRRSLPRYGRVTRRLDKLRRGLKPPFRSLATFEPDVICISQGMTYDSVFALDLTDLISRLDNDPIPYVVVCQYNDDTPMPSLHRREAAARFFDRATRVAFVSQGNKRAAERQLARSLPNAIVVRNPVNLTDLTTVPWPEPGVVHMASVARLDTVYKGQDILLEALSGHPWHDRHWHLRLYGAGPDRGYLEALAQHYGVAARVEFAGHVDDIRAVWADNHLLVLASRGEGTPLALVEAMLCGRPSVVTDVGGNAEWIEEQQTGFIAEAATASSVGSALDRAWLAQASWPGMGDRAHDVALRYLGPPPGKILLDIVLHAAQPASSNLVVAEDGH